MKYVVEPFMKIHFKQKFKYCWDTKTVYEILPGTYEVPRQVAADVAKLALELGGAVIVPEPVKKKRKVTKKMVKKAPENKAKGSK